MAKILRKFFRKFPFLLRCIKTARVFSFDSESVQALIAKKVNKVKGKVVFIDVGCFEGFWWKTLYEHILPWKKIISIGIDSLGKYKKNVLFVQLETHLSPDKYAYENPTWLADDVVALQENGFVMFYVKAYLNTEADVVYANEALYKKMFK